MGWNYQREEQKFEQVPVGKHRIRILNAEKAVSRQGNDMLVLQFEVSGMDLILYHYIVFLDDRPEVTNRMLTQFFDSFKDIEDGDFNMSNWVGKVGACKVNVDKNDPDRTRLSWFIHADRQSDLPPWKEPDSSASRAMGAQGLPGFGMAQTEDIPF